MPIFTRKASAKVDGQNDDHNESETVLFGDDLSHLTQIDEGAEGDGQSPEASTEGLGENGVTTKKDDSSSPKGAYVVAAEDQCQCQQKPCVSRVIDAEGVAHITIILGQPERTLWLGQVVGLLDSASEKDIVDITITANVYGAAGTTEHRSLLSAIDRCKACVITRAGALTTVGDVAIWLAGDDIRWSKKMSAIFMRQPLSGYIGDVADFESKMAAAKRDWEEFRDYIVERGLFTKEELDSLYTTRGMLALFGDELEERMSNLKQAA